MSIGEELLDLTEEYRRSKENRANEWTGTPGLTPDGREPSEIAADYEAALRKLLGSDEGGGERSGAV